MSSFMQTIFPFLCVCLLIAIFIGLISIIHIWKQTRIKESVGGQNNVGKLTIQVGFVNTDGKLYRKSAVETDKKFIEAQKCTAFVLAHKGKYVKTTGKKGIYLFDGISSDVHLLYLTPDNELIINDLPVGNYQVVEYQSRRRKTSSLKTRINSYKIEYDGEKMNMKCKISVREPLYVIHQNNKNNSVNRLIRENAYEDKET